MTAGNGMIVEETAEIHELPQRIPMVTPSMMALRGPLQTICSLVWVGWPSCTLIVLFQRDWYQERGQSMIGTQKKKGCGRFGPDYGKKSWVLAHGLGSWSSKNGIRQARYCWLYLNGRNECYSRKWHDCGRNGQNPPFTTKNPYGAT